MLIDKLNIINSIDINYNYDDFNNIGTNNLVYEYINNNENIKNIIFDFLDVETSIKLYNNYNYQLISIKKQNSKLNKNKNKNKDKNEDKDININEDKDTYLKPWIKLDKFQKINRLMSYVNNLNLSVKEIFQFKKLLLNNVIDKKLLKKNEINYDDKKGIIISIYNLKKNSKNEYYINNDLNDCDIVKVEKNNNIKNFKNLDFNQLFNLIKK